MDPAFLAPLIPITAIVAFAAVKIARLRATLPGSSSGDVAARLDALERSLEDVQQELAETQERLDFAERVLSKAREDRRIGRSGMNDGRAGFVSGGAAWTRQGSIAAAAHSPTRW